MPMPIKIDGRKFYRTSEALIKVGISKATWFRWVKSKKIQDVKHKDIRGWRLFTDEDVSRIKKFANSIKLSA